jgi:serine/threonine protein kinase
MNTYPAPTDYFKAVQFPAQAFTLESLQKAKFASDGLGLPTLATGSSAVVFHAAVDESPMALRCFIRNDASSRDRYGALGQYLSNHDLSPQVSATTWLDAAIQVNGATWPVLQMEWIDGRALDQYIDFLTAGCNTGALAALADRWRELITRLQEAEFAHGDLQHGNILVDQEGQLRLVDFDGVWIPALASKAAPTESGHQNYQHPRHHGPVAWGRWLDTFSALVIYLSLVALSKDPGLWQPLYNSKNLLFQQADFLPPFETQAWKHLAAVRDPEVDHLAGRLMQCCDPAWVANKSLEMTIDQPWWEKQGVAQTTQGSANAEPEHLTGAETGVPASPVPGPSLPSPLPKPPSWSYQASPETRPSSKAGPPTPGPIGGSAGPRAAGRPSQSAGQAQWWAQAGQHPGHVPPTRAGKTPRKAAAHGSPGRAGKRRNPVTVWLLWPLLTFGIYGLVWYYKINREARRLGVRVSPFASLLAVTLGAIVIVPPLVSVYQTGGRITRMQRAAGLTPTCSPVAGFLLMVFLFGSGMVYYQAELNKIWDHYANPPKGPSIPAAAVPV